LLLGFIVTHIPTKAKQSERKFLTKAQDV